MLLGLLCISAKAQQSPLVIGQELPRFGGNSINSKAPVSVRKWLDSGFVVAVSFGATWCIPCKIEQPFLDSLAQKHPKLRIISVLTDRELNSKVQKYAMELPVRFPILHDFGGILSRRYSLGPELPYLVVADSRGIIQWTHTGFDLTQKPQITKQLTEILAKQ